MRRVIILVAVGVMVACEQRPPFLRTLTPHDAYAGSLRTAGLHETALGRDWVAAGEAALRDARATTLPLQVATPFTAAEPRAIGYRLSLKRGRVLRVEIAPAGDQTLVFLDLFRAPAQPGEPATHIVSAERGTLVIEREIDRDGDYLLRIQPELLRSGTLKIVQRTTAALSFPVAGRNRAAVQSYFRDPRDGGRREHHGVDIFAPRDTPVLAASSGLVSSVATTPVGGHVVWVWDPRRGQSHYYAHLSRQSVRMGQPVTAGDVIGYVGNTGNARTTPPHLHFGIYARGDGPIDPLPFVAGD
jgi:murein DD-endopeptidase MepM/ murein hydrolase activator NlpD